MAKPAVLELLDSPKLFSRKIWEIEKSWNSGPEITEGTEGAWSYLMGYLDLEPLYRTIAQFGKFVFGPWFDVITGLVIITICILISVLQLVYSLYGIRNKRLGVIIFNIFVRFVQIATGGLI